MRDRKISFPKNEMDRLKKHGEQTFPEECCGVLIGNYIDGIPEVTETRPMKNINLGSKKTRYDIDPLDLVKLEDEIDELGLEMLGIYHSHPNHPARLSETDFEFAWPNLSYTVISVKDGTTALITSWRLEMNGSEKIKFIQEEIIVKE